MCVCVCRLRGVALLCGVQFRAARERNPNIFPSICAAPHCERSKCDDDDEIYRSWVWSHTRDDTEYLRNRGGENRGETGRLSTRKFLRKFSSEFARASFLTKDFDRFRALIVVIIIIVMMIITLRAVVCTLKKGYLKIYPYRIIQNLQTWGYLQTFMSRINFPLFLSRWQIYRRL